MREGVASVSIVASLAISVPAVADSPPSRGLGDRGAATPAAVKDEPAWQINRRRQALIQEGEALARQGQWAEASERFQQALEIRSEPKTLLWIAFCEEQQGHLVRAQAFYTKARDEARAAKLKAQEGNAVDALAKLEPQIPRLTIRFPADVEAKVSLDGQPVDTRADTVPVDPGRHVVRATATGREDFTQDVDAELGGGPLVVAIVLTPKPEPKPAAPAITKVNAAAPPSSTGPLVLGGSGLAVAVLGGGLIGASRTGPRDDKPLLITGGTMVAVGAGAGVGALVWWLSGNHASRVGGGSAPPTVSVSPLPGGGWATVQGKF